MRRGSYGVPPDVDRIVVGRRSADDGRRTARLIMVKMPMGKGCTGPVIEVIRVDMGERSLIEPKQQG